MCNIAPKELVLLRFRPWKVECIGLYAFDDAVGQRVRNAVGKKGYG